MYRKLGFLLAVLSLALTLGTRPTPAGAPTGRMIVKFQGDVDPAAVADVAAGCGARLASCAGPYHLLTGNADAIRRAFYGSAVEYVEPETVMRAFAAPNDPMFPK